MTDEPARPKREKKAELKLESKRRAWSLTRPDPLTSLVLSLPLFVVYHVGILFTRGRNGVDFVTNVFTSLARHSTPLYLGVVALVAVGIVVTAITLGRKQRVAPAAFVPLLLESAVWAVLLTVVVGSATARIFGAQIGPQDLGPVDQLVLSCGAGVHEELVFRVALFGGGTAILKRWPLFPAVLAMPVALVVSSVLFSLVHYLGGEPFRLVSFVFRFLMGVGLALIYRYRGYAVASWSHALYDVFVFLIAT